MLSVLADNSKMRSFSLSFLSVSVLIGLSVAVGKGRNGFYSPYYMPYYPPPQQGFGDFVAFLPGKLDILFFSHYENTPIQIYRKFHLQKLKSFSQKNSDIFHICAQNIDCGYSLEPPRRGGSNEYSQYMFLNRNKKNNAYPCKPQFYYIKVGFKGVKNI